MMKTDAINIRDPYILPYEGKYYMYGTRMSAELGFDVYISDDLENWSEPKPVFENSDDFWGDRNFRAPEVHEYKGKFYMLATFKSETAHRGTQILVSDTPDGVFTEHSSGAVTPSDWECLDGTLYISRKGIPYMVFCHEWTQIKDGTMCYIQLSEDLKRAVSEPVLMWRSSEHKSSKNSGKDVYVTDGPFLHRSGDELFCIWSCFGKDGYIEAVAKSDNGEIDGKWIQEDRLLFEYNGGHGMIFRTFDGRLKFVFHSPNSPRYSERPCIRDTNL